MCGAARLLAGFPTGRPRVEEAKAAGERDSLGGRYSLLALIRAFGCRWSGSTKGGEGGQTILSELKSYDVFALLVAL